MFSSAFTCSMWRTSRSSSAFRAPSCDCKKSDPMSTSKAASKLKLRENLQSSIWFLLSSGNTSTKPTTRSTKTERWPIGRADASNSGGSARSTTPSWTSLPFRTFRCWAPRRPPPKCPFWPHSDWARCRPAWMRSRCWTWRRSNSCGATMIRWSSLRRTSFRIL